MILATEAVVVMVSGITPLDKKQMITFDDSTTKNVNVDEA